MSPVMVMAKLYTPKAVFVNRITKDMRQTRGSAINEFDVK